MSGASGGNRRIASLAPLFLQAGVFEPNGTNVALTAGLQAIVGT